MKLKLRNFYYLLSLLFVFVIPVVIQAYFVWSRISLFDLITFMVLMTVMGGIWDIWATRHGERDPIWLWQFNFKNTLGIKLFDLPIEEYLFYVVSSVSIVFFWETIKFTRETGSLFLYGVLSFVSLWCLFFILVPYIIFNRKDKL